MRRYVRLFAVLLGNARVARRARALGGWRVRRSGGSRGLATLALSAASPWSWIAGSKNEADNARAAMTKAGAKPGAAGPPG